MPIYAAGAMLIGSVFSASEARKSQKDMISEMKKQRQLAQKQLDFSMEQWNTYRDTYGNIEKQMVADATEGVVGDYFGAAQRAGIDIEGEFTRVQDEQQRDMQRYGLDPSSGRYISSDRSMGLQKATATALAKNTARQDEKQRADDATWQRRQAIGSYGGNMIKGAQDNVNKAQENMAVMAGQRAQYHGNLASNLFNQAGELGVMGALTLGQAMSAPKQTTDFGGDTSWVDSNPSISAKDFSFGLDSKTLNNSVSSGLNNMASGSWQNSGPQSYGLSFNNVKY